ncbi:MAG: hypothetical protein EAZ84_10155 [Verrucomicrobia bacterium]|nr:MAG: hypothetical protein EAZ84_10155 [Verrucomicrobiota bacterium]TAE86357.1 MAG: hypothetical protein EAZ82_11320 [Verrucomicrobiota bacterium]TAF24358.1 MAG: hypothetical protein EAZ71_10825 [Verrucomicrobiota bacterium]
MEAEQTQSFNQKLSQWIASQGFWFQLRHSMSGGGGWAMTFHHLMRLALKLFVALLVAAGAFGIYLVKRVDSPKFVESLNGKLASGLGATEVKVLDFARAQGEVQIRRVGAEGGEGCFFKSLDAGNLRMKMGLLDGLTGTWDAGTLIAKWMEIDLKAGADSPEEAEGLGRSLFRYWESFRFSSLEVDEATLRWGFSQRTQGRITKSRMTATRSVDGWRLVFRGGSFSQNWLKDLEIVEMVAEIGSGGLKVTKGEFKSGGGDVVFKDVIVTGGERPQVSGSVEVNKVSLDPFIPLAVHPFLEGVISGNFALSGSTNSVEGIQIEGDVTLGGGNLVSLRERLELLNALSVVDVYNSYHKVPFDRGSFHLRTVGGAMELTRIDLKAGELMTVQGRIQVRFPRDEEMVGPDGNPLLGQFATASDANGEVKKSKAEELTLAKAAKAASGEEQDMGIFYRRAQERIDDQLLQEEMARRAKSLRCEGGVRITIPGDAFDRSEVLRGAFPVDPSNGRIAMDVPLQGALFELTLRQAEELRDLGTRR